MYASDAATEIDTATTEPLPQQSLDVGTDVDTHADDAVTLEAIKLEVLDPSPPPQPTDCPDQSPSAVNADIPNIDDVTTTDLRYFHADEADALDETLFHDCICTSFTGRLFVSIYSSNIEIMHDMWKNMHCK